MGLIYKQQDSPYAPDLLLVATWEDGSLFRRLYGWNTDGINFQIRRTSTSGSGHLELSTAEFYVLSDGSFEVTRFREALPESMGRVRWALDQIGLVSKARRHLSGGKPVNGRHAYVDPRVVLVRRRGGGWSAPLVQEIGRVVAHHRDLREEDRLHRMRESPDWGWVKQAMAELVAGLGIEEGCELLLGLAEDAEQTWVTANLRRKADYHDALWKQTNLSFEWLWNSLMFGGHDGYLLCEGDSHDMWRVALVPADEYETWADSRLDPGTLSVPQEELDLFRLLGEPSPYVWPAERLVEWVREREGSQ